MLLNRGSAGAALLVEAVTIALLPSHPLKERPSRFDRENLKFFVKIPLLSYLSIKCRISLWIQRGTGLQITALIVYGTNTNV